MAIRARVREEYSPHFIATRRVQEDYLSCGHYTVPPWQDNRELKERNASFDHPHQEEQRWHRFLSACRTAAPSNSLSAQPCPMGSGGRAKRCEIDRRQSLA